MEENYNKQKTLVENELKEKTIKISKLEEEFQEKIKVFDFHFLNNFFLG